MFVNRGRGHQGGKERKGRRSTKLLFPRRVSFLFQIAAKIGGDGVAAPPTNEFGYGGQKRPLEDAGGYFPMPNLNIGQWLKSIQCKSSQLMLACVCVFLFLFLFLAATKSLPRNVL